MSNELEKLKEKNVELEKKLRGIKNEMREDRKKKRNEEVKHFIRKYELDPKEIVNVKKIGGGGQGEVWVAKWKGAGGNIDVVVKYVKLFGKKMTKLGFFDLELVKVKEQLFHPSIVQIFGFFVPGLELEDWHSVFPKDYGIVMEKMDSDLLKLVEKKQVSIPDKCKIMRKMAVGLNYLHHKNVIHRDIKCQNYLQKYKGKIVKISDLGIVRTPSGMQQTGSGEDYSFTEVGGTWRWEAPEIHQIRESQKKSMYSMKTDMFALGMAFYEILFERKPYIVHEKKHNLGRLEIIRRIWQENLRPDITSSNLPSGLAKLLGFLWDEVPGKRISCPKVIDYLDQMMPKYERRYADKYMIAKKKSKK